MTGGSPLDEARLAALEERAVAQLDARSARAVAWAVRVGHLQDQPRPSADALQRALSALIDASPRDALRLADVLERIPQGVWTASEAVELSLATAEVRREAGQ